MLVFSGNLMREDGCCWGVFIPPNELKDTEDSSVRSLLQGEAGMVLKSCWCRSVWTSYDFVIQVPIHVLILQSNLVPEITAFYHWWMWCPNYHNLALISFFLFNENDIQMLVKENVQGVKNMMGSRGQHWGPFTCAKPSKWEIPNDKKLWF